MQVDQTTTFYGLELMEPLKRVVFECFAANKSPVQFIGSYNRLLDWELLPPSNKAEATIQTLIEIGCAKNDCHPLLLAYLDTLWECNYFDYKQYINSLSSFRDLEKPNCVLTFVNKTGLLLKKIDCDFREDKSVYELCTTFVNSLKWYSELLFDIFSARRENSIFIAKPILNQIEFFSTDNFAKYVIFCSACIDPETFQRLYEQSCTTCEQMQEMSRNIYISKEIKESVETLPQLFKTLPAKPNFPVDYVESYRFGTTQPRPAILSLVTVYSVFRVLSTNEEIANALMNIGEIMLMSKVQILVDLFRGIFLILLDYHDTDEQSADQHRDLHTLILAEVFVYKRVAQIVELLVDSTHFSVEELSQALRKLASNSVLLNALDRRQLDNTLANVLDNSRIPSLLGNEEYSKIMELRMQGMKRDADLFYLLYGNPNIDPAQRERSRHFQFKNADQTAQKIRENPDGTERLMIELIDRADLIHLDLVLASLCTDGKIKTFSSKLALYIQTLEKSGAGEDVTKRNETFDSAFLLLMRIRQIFQELRLEEMTDGATTSIFYRWTEKFYDQLELGQPLPVNEEIKQSTFMTHFTRLKLGHPFWNNSWDYGQLLDHAPAIGEALLEEMTSDRVDEESLKNILQTFDGISCMFLCLCQWLETNPSTEHLQTLASGLRDVGLKFIEQLATSDSANKPQLQHQIKRWTLTMQLIGPTLNRLARGPRVCNITYPYLVNYAHRQVRPLDPTEIPDMQVLKDAFFFATQQGWTSPNVLVCIDRLTKNIKQVEWVQCWFRQMVNKQGNADELEIGAEICIAAAMTKPVVCLLCIIQKIIDEHEFTNSGIGFNHTWILARMLVRAMLIVCWADDKWQNKRQRFKDWQLSRKRKAEADQAIKDDGEASNDHINETGPDSKNDNNNTVVRTLQTVFLMFQKAVKPSLIRLRITFICFFMFELAMAPQNEYRQRLIQMIPDGMIFTLCRLEPTCFNLPILLKIYDMENPEHRQICLQLACMLRRIHST